MPIATIAALVELLEANNILPGQFRATVATLEADNATPEAAIDWLVGRKWLTTFQAEQLRRDRVSQLVLDPYILLELLGEGGMGQVYKARHQILDRIVALKVIRSERVTFDTESVRRFQREARAAAQLSHPNIVLVYDAARSGETHFIAMEYVDGTDLSKLVAQSGPLPIAQACDFVRQAALGLQHAHEHGMVHRDIKPSNLLATALTSRAAPIKPKPSGVISVSDLRRPAPKLVVPGAASQPTVAPVQSAVIKILDMGLVRLSQGNDTALTQAGSVIGTPDYISPEQARDATRVDIRADLYSLGCTFYFLLTGKPPFPEGTAIEKLLKHQLDEPRSVVQLRPDLSGEITHVVHKLLAKLPEHRYQTPIELVEELESMALPQSTIKESGSGSIRGLTRTMPELEQPNKSEQTTRVFQEQPSPQQGEPPPGTVNQTTSPTERIARYPSKTTPRVAPPPPRIQFLDPPAVQAYGLTPATPAPLGEPPPPVPPNADTAVAPALPRTINPAKRIATVDAHSESVTALAFTPNRGILASCSEDGIARVWGVNGNDLIEMAILRKHGDKFRSLAFAPNNRYLATGMSAHTGLVWIFDIAEEKPQGTTVLQGHRGSVDALAYSPDGKFLVCGGSDTVLRLWEPVPGNLKVPRMALRGHTQPITAVCFTNDGLNLASASLDSTVRLWIPGGGWAKERAILQHDAPVDAIAYSPDGQTLATASRDNIIRLWDLTTLKPTVRVGLKGHAGRVKLLLTTPEAKLLVSIGDGPQVINWHLRTGELLCEWQMPRSRTTSYALTHDGRYMASGTADGLVAVHRVADKR